MICFSFTKPSSLASWNKPSGLSLRREVLLHRLQHLCVSDNNISMRTSRAAASHEVTGADQVAENKYRGSAQSTALWTSLKAASPAFILLSIIRRSKPRLDEVSWLRLSAAMQFSDMHFLAQHANLRNFTSFLYISFFFLVFTCSPPNTVPFLYTSNLSFSHMHLSMSKLA